MKEEMTLNELLPNQFYINEEGNMVAEISLKNINEIADILTNYYRENEKLNNIINELEKYFEQEGFWHSLDKIKELKGSDK